MTEKPLSRATPTGVYICGTYQTRKRIGTTHHQRGVYGVAFSPDDQQLAAASWDRTVKVYGLLNGKEIIAEQDSVQTLKGVREPFNTVDFTSEERLAAGTANGEVVLWDLTRWQRVGTTVRTANDKTGTAFTADGQTIVLYSGDSLTFRPVAPMPPAGPSQPDPTVEAHQKGIARLVAATGGNYLFTV